MAVIWGLDLRDMQWGKFKSSYMFGNRDYHLRRTKFVVYQLAMLFCVVSESVGTSALSKYTDQQTKIEKMHTSARVHNDDFVGAASYNIFVGIFVATIFGAAFFFDLFWPERHEPTNIRWAWRICAVVATVMCLGSALTLTIIVATGKSTISANSEDARQIAIESIGPPLVYSHYASAIISVVFVWLGFVSTVASTIILFAYYKHLDLYGPKTLSAKQRDDAVKPTQSEKLTTTTSPPTSTSPDSARTPMSQASPVASKEVV